MYYSQIRWRNLVCICLNSPNPFQDTTCSQDRNYHWGRRGDFLGWKLKKNADSSSYHTVLLKFDLIVVSVMLQDALGYTRPSSIERHDIFFCFSRQKGRFRCVFIGNENDVLPRKTKTQSKYRSRKYRRSLSR